MTPMFSAYVVVGEPPTALVITVPNPSAATARPTTGSRSTPVIPETALTWPMFSATSAITAGSANSAKVIENDGRCQPTASRLPARVWLPVSPSAVCGGKPNQSADATPDQSTRSWAIAFPPEEGVGEVIWPKIKSASQETT
jgi:hypothetical protein